MTKANATKPVPSTGEAPFVADKPKLFAPATGRWIPFSERFPDPRPAIDDPTVMVRAHVLVTNNITAVDRSGRPSHVWWLCPQVAQSSHAHYDKGDIIGMSEGHWVINLTHWFDPFCQPEPLIFIDKDRLSKSQQRELLDALTCKLKTPGCKLASGESPDDVISRLQAIASAEVSSGS